jgi:WS/DGAT/MGAT family acyltransferase
MASLFDLEPDVDTPPPADDWAPDPVPSGWDLLSAVPAATFERARRVPETMIRTARGMTGLIGAMFPTDEDGTRRYLAPRTPYNGALSPRRSISFAVASLPEVKRVKQAFGVTVNDVVLAAVASSLRADLSELCAIDDLQGRPLVAAVPISVRPPDLERDFGNHTSAMMVLLPAQLDDPVDRLHAIHELAVRTKDQHQAMGTDLLEGWAELFPPWAVSAGSRTAERFGLGGLIPPLFNLIVSNVQGSPIPLYLAGAEVTAIYPLGPLTSGAGLNITVISQGDRLHIGLIADPSLVDHPGEITRGVQAGIDELLARIPEKEATAPRRRNRPLRSVEATG